LAAAAALLALAAVRVVADPVADVLGRGGFAAADRERIAAILRSAADRGIPLDLTLPRLQEGVAKRVPADRVCAVLAQEIERLGKARALLAELGESPAAWQRGATLLAWGAGESDIVALASASAGRVERFAQAAGLLVSLVQWGLERPLALQLAVAAAASALPADELPGIVPVLAAGARQRRDPVELARSIVVELRVARSVKQLRERTLHE
jgi:hypothetical protein